MATSTLSQIRKKVRRLTASPDEAQLSTADLDEYIDVFYEQDFPSHLKIWKLKDTYEFWTNPNVDRYTINSNDYHTIEQPIMCDGYFLDYNQDKARFYSVWPKVPQETTPRNGSGVALVPNFTIQGAPLLANEITIATLDATPEEMILEDDGAGNLIDAGGTTVRGQINYVTGAVSNLTFPNATVSTEPIRVRAVPYSPGRPSSILFFQDYVILRPVPDKVYRVEMNVYRRPTQFLDLTNPVTTNEPEIKRWWQYIAFGAALKVLQDRLDTESIEQIYPFYEEQKRLLLYDTAAKRHEQRAATIYSSGNGWIGNYPGTTWGS